MQLSFTPHVHAQCYGAHCAVLLQPEVKVSISHFMSYVHMSVKEMSQTYLAVERRYNYTTPKTFLEQIKLYQTLLSKKRSELTAKIERLENGLTKLQSTALQVGMVRLRPEEGWWAREQGLAPHRALGLGNGPRGLLGHGWQCSPQPRSPLVPSGIDGARPLPSSSLCRWMS